MTTSIGGDETLAARVAELGPARRELLARALARQRTGAAGRDPSHPAAGAERLVAHVVFRPGHEDAADRLRQFLIERLPEYMVPQRIAAVPALPRTPAGKIDRKAVARLAPAGAVGPDPAGATQTPATTDDTNENPAEVTLSGIWAEVLGLSEVGVHENYFELGGDSLLSIRILARANQAGLRINPEQFFALPTIAEQAAAAVAAGASRAGRDRATGDLPLTPIQHWFAEHIPIDPHQWNQSLLFSLRVPIGLSSLERALQALLVHHDGLRLERRDGDATGQRIVAPSATLPVTHLDLSAVPDAEVAARIEAQATALNESFDLGAAPLVRACLVATRPGSADRLILVIHHLAVDGVSWRILLEDLDRALADAERGEPLRLPAKTASLRNWVARLVERADTAEVKSEAAYWCAASMPGAALPVDRRASPAENLVATARTVSATLDAADTEALLRELPAAFRTRINEVLLTGLAVVLAQWTGEQVVRLDLEGHGREAFDDGVDLSRTVGWFTSVFPVRIDLGEAGADHVATVAAVKDQVRAIPGAGIGYGLLRELCTDETIRTRLRDHPPPQILFNYLGQVDRLATRGEVLELENEDCGASRSPRGQRAYLIEVNARVVDGVLHTDWTFSASFHDEETVSRLATSYTAVLGSLIGAARAGVRGDLTPSDFPLADMDRNELDQLSKLIEGIDDEG